MNQRLNRLTLLLFLSILLTIPFAPTLAQAASITVNPVWHPSIQLTSSGSDLRFAQADIWVTTNVQFWLAQFTCTVNGTALTIAPVVTWSPGVWGATPGTDYASILSPYSAGKITLTASKLEPSAPVGTNGVVQTFLLANLNYELPLTLTTAATSPFTCTAIFMDKNGKPIVTPVIKAPPALQIVTGYPLKGTTTYQGRTASAGIRVECSNPSANPNLITTTTLANGSFSFTNVRGLGTYNCLYSGTVYAIDPLASSRSLYIRGYTRVDLSAQGFTLAPVVLKGGDIDRSGTIDSGDLGTLTGHFGATGATPDLGDINGDSKVDQADLAILTSNYNQSDILDERHLLLGISRNPSILYNNRIWLGDVKSNAVIPYGGSATAKMYWPQLSPDGSKIAYIQEVKPGVFDPLTGDPTTLPRYALFVGTAGGTSGTQITPANWNYDAFAPAWSPDGSKIAFSCGKSNGDPTTAQWTSGIDFNGLCVIDANGANFTVVTAVTSFIRRPTWVSNTQIVVTVDGYSILTQWDLTTRTSTDLANVPSGVLPVYKNGKLFYFTGIGQLNVIDYANLGLDPNAIPPYVARDAGSLPPVHGYHTDVADNGTLLPISFSSNFNDYDISSTGMDIVVDDGTGTYRLYYEMQDPSLAPPTYQQFGQVTIDGAVSTPLSSVFTQAVRNTVNFVP